MANDELVALLERGVEAWNEWRRLNPETNVDLSYAELHGYYPRADLSGAYLYKAGLTRAVLYESDFCGADMRAVDLHSAHLTGAKMDDADLRGARLRSAFMEGVSLRRAHLDEANLSWTRLDGADLHEAHLRKAILVETDLRNADLSSCAVYGISAWNLQLDGTKQTNLIITRPEEPTVTVDDLEVAQFVYLLLTNKTLQRVIDTVTAKAVLILGRFTKRRKAVLDAIRDELRSRDLLPIIFDFDKPSSRDLTETISTLAHMSRFVIADITHAKSIPQELQAIVPHLPSVPVQPIAAQSAATYSMFEHFQRYPWVLPLYRYATKDQLIRRLVEDVITPSEAKAREFAGNDRA